MGDGKKPSWDERVASIERTVGRQANRYMTLGYVVYGLGSLVLIYLLRKEPFLVTLVVMYFFQLCLIYFGTQAIYRHIALATRSSIEASRDSVPAMEELSRAIGEIRTEKDSFRQEVRQASLDIRDEGARIREEIRRLSDVFTTPIKPLPPRQTVGVRSGEEGNGAGAA